MRIDNLIEELQILRKKEGNIECVQEIDDFFESEKVNSTIESLRVIDFNNEKAVKLDWRM